MSREQGRDPFRLVRTDIFGALDPDFGLNSRTVSSSYQDSTHGSNQGNLKIFSHSSNRNIRDAANMPIFVEDTHESVLTANRNFNKGCDSKILPETARLHNIPISAAIESLQSYGPVTQSPSHLPVTKDWDVDFRKNVKNHSEKLPAFSTGMLKSKDSYLQMDVVESSSRHTSDIPTCQPFNDLNLKSVDEEDEFLYGDSNSLPEIPRSLKNDSDQSNAKPDPGWTDDEDLFGESPNTPICKLNPDRMKSSTIWNIREKNIGSKLVQIKPEGNTNRSSSRNMLPETFSFEPYHSSASSTELQTIRQLSNKVTEKNAKTIVPDKDSKVTSTSGVKSKYHVAAQVLRKEIAEKSKLFENKTMDFSSNCPDDTKTNSVSESFRNDIHESDLIAKSNAQNKDSKEIKISKLPGKKPRKLPKAFLQKNLDCIKDYIKGSKQKRVHSQEEYEHETKHPRQENYSDLSPSRHHSPYESLRHRSPVNEYRHRSPYHSRRKSPGSDSRYGLSSYHLKHKSPPRDYERHSYEHSPRHYERRRHLSRSPGKKASERSPGYFKYKARSPGFRRSRERSRSPGYYRSSGRSKEHNYKKDSYRPREASQKSMSEHYHSRKGKNDLDYSSGESFCSLSFESQSVSSNNSDDSSAAKEKSVTKPLPQKKFPGETKSSKMDNSKVEKKASEDLSVKNADTLLLPSDITQNLSDICNFQDKTARDGELTKDGFKTFNKDEEDKLNNILKMIENSQMISKLVEGVQEHSSTFTSSVPPVDIAHNTTNLLTPRPPVPNISLPSISCSQSFPVMPPGPIPFPPPNVNSFPPLTYPPPAVMPPVLPTSVYGPFPVSIPSVEVCRTPDTKQVIKKRPATLRTISLTKDINLKAIPSKSSNEYPQSSPAKSAEATEKIVGKVKAMNEKPTAVSVAEQNAALFEKVKKLKTERHLAHSKVNSSVSDILEMRKMMEDTFRKKMTNDTEKVFHLKCKNLLSISSDTMNYNLKEAKRLDDELCRFKGKLPRELQEEVANIKVELPKVDNFTEYYSCFDSRNHTCYLCYKQFPNLLGILEHLHSTEHKELMSSNDKDWVKKFKKPEQNEDGKKVVLKPVSGVEFMKPFTGYFCTLCSETLLDSMSAEQHLKSHDHFWQYKDYILKNPLYERKCLFKKYIQHSVFSKEKKKREIEEKEQQVINRKKIEEADEKVKEMIRDQKSKEKVVDELEEKDDADSPSSKNQSLPGIKLTLSGEKEKTKEKGAKVSATKTVQKVVYIGKAPNFKSRPKAWYKRDIYKKNTERSSDSTGPSLPVGTTSKTEEKVSVPAMESSPANEPEVSSNNNQNFLGQDISDTVKKKEKAIVKKAVKSTCLTEEESKNLGTSHSDLNNSTIPLTEKSPTFSNESVKSCDSKAPVKQLTSMQREKDTCYQPKSCINKNKSNTMPVTEDLAVNQALKNILLGTDSSMHQDIPLSEIHLPDIPVSSNSISNSVLHGESNIPVPMEIDDSPDKSVPDFHLKLTTEEDRDLFILGINKEDLRPLVMPVPPPSSVLNCVSLSHIPTFSNLNSAHDSSSAAKNVNKNAKGSMVIPVSIPTHLSKSSNFKKQMIEAKSNKNNRNLITIVPTDNQFELNSVLISDAGKIVATSEELRNSITKFGTSESIEENSKDEVAKVCIPSQDVNIESNVGAVTNGEKNVFQKSETDLEAAKTLPVEIDNITKGASISQTDILCKNVESVNERTLSDNKDFIKEPNSETSVSNLCLVETVSQDQIVEKIAVTNDHASATDLVILKSKEIDADNASILKSKSLNSFNLVDESVEMNSEVPVSKDSDNGVLMDDIKPHEVIENSSVNNITEQRLTSGLDSALTQQAQDLNPSDILATDAESPEQCLSKSVCSTDSVRMEIALQQQAIFKEKSQCDVKCSQVEMNSEVPVPRDNDDGVLMDGIHSEEGLRTDTFDPRLKVISSEQQAQNKKFTQFDTEVHEVLSSSPSSTFESCKESISETKICLPISESVDINMTAPVNNSSDILATDAESLSEQCLSKYVCSTDSIRMEIAPQQQAVLEKSQCDVKSNQELNPVQLSNQDLCKESISDVRESKLHHEPLSIEKPSETESVKNAFDNVSIDRSGLISEKLSKGTCSGTVYSDVKQLPFELQSIHMKQSECEVVPNDGFVFQQSSNQCDETSEKATLCVVDASSPEQSVDENVNVVKVSLVRESFSEQEATREHDVISEIIPAIKKEFQETSPESNASVLSLMDLENKTSDHESKTHLLSSSGDSSETHNFPKSDTDTDEYETEE